MSQTPKLEDVIFAAINDNAAAQYTAVPGKVVSYDPVTQLAKVQIQINQADPTPDGTGTLDYPTIPSVPIMFPGSGKFRLTFPITKGEHVLVVVSTFYLGRWLKTGTASEDEGIAADKNSMSSGFAIPGLFPALKTKPPLASQTEVILHTDGKVVKIGNDATELLALKSDLEALRAALQTAIITLGAGGAATVVTAANAIVSGGTPGGTPGVWPVGTTKTKAK